MSNHFFRNAHVQFLAAITDINQLEGWLKDHPVQTGLAMVGRSNVGKSSLINALFSKKTARVSNTPGRTQSINIFSFTISQDSPTYFLYDLPGYGHAEVSKTMKKQWNLLLAMFFQNLPSDVLLLNIQDARHPLQKADHEFLFWLMNYPHIACFLCMNKFDKIKTQKEKSAVDKDLKAFLNDYPQYNHIYKISAETMTGLPDLYKDILDFISEGKHEI